MRWRAILSFLFVGLAMLNAVVIFVLFRTPHAALTVSFLNVGQGDAILIESPTGVQVLVDGGRDRSVLRELPKVMGPFDRTIDLVVETHPDADHIGGLPYVFDRYRVGQYVGPGISVETPAAAAFLAARVNERELVSLVAERGQRLLLGGGAYIDVLYPDRGVSDLESNTGSVVLRVVYGDTSFLLSGDAPDEIENWLVLLDEASVEVELDSDVLKAGHHGSNTSTSLAWLAAVSPSVVVVSAGKDNSYGHPHKQVVERIADSGAKLHQTSEEGTIRFISDGQTVTRK